MTNDSVPVIDPLKSLKKNLIFPPRPPVRARKHKLLRLEIYAVAFSRVDRDRVKKRFFSQRVDSTYCELVSFFFHLPDSMIPHMDELIQCESGHLENFSTDSHVEKCPVYDFIKLLSSFSRSRIFQSPL